MKILENRKDDHVKLAEKFHNSHKISDFDNIRFVHHAFPEIGLGDVDISTKFASFKLSQPFFINAMTGGSEKTRLINEKLSIVARETELPIASGSLSAAIKDPTVRDSFDIIRKTNPKGLVFANLGAEHSVENVKRAIDILKADAVQIHCNVVQEIIMPEGDKDFSNWLTNIEKIVKEIDIPVIVKEVGFGMSKESIKQLVDIGVKTIDVGGKGGTNFAKIENYRRENKSYYYLEDFGQSTAISLLEAESYIEQVDIIATGGIRNPLDISKSLALGAKAVGIAGTFLNMVLNQGVDKTIENINHWKIELASIMTLLGKRNVEELIDADLLIFNELKEWCQSRSLGKKYLNE